MKIFEGLFGRNDRTKKSAPTNRYDEFDYATSERQSAAPIEIFHPASFDDVERIINALRSGKNAIVHLENVKPATALRVLDMLSGAVYALNGGLYEMQKNTYMFSPSGVAIK